MACARESYSSDNDLSNTLFRSRKKLNLITPMSDQDRISTHSIDTKSSRQVMRIKKKYKLGNQ